MFRKLLLILAISTLSNCMERTEPHSIRYEIALNSFFNSLATLIIKDQIIEKSTSYLPEASIQQAGQLLRKIIAIIFSIDDNEINQELFAHQKANNFFQEYDEINLQTDQNCCSTCYQNILNESDNQSKSTNAIFCNVCSRNFFETLIREPQLNNNHIWNSILFRSCCEDEFNEYLRNSELFNQNFEQQASYLETSMKLKFCTFLLSLIRHKIDSAKPTLLLYAEPAITELLVPLRINDIREVNAITLFQPNEILKNLWLLLSATYKKIQNLPDLRIQKEHIKELELLAELYENAKEITAQKKPILSQLAELNVNELDSCLRAVYIDLATLYVINKGEVDLIINYINKAAALEITNPDPKVEQLENYQLGILVTKLNNHYEITESATQIIQRCKIKRSDCCSLKDKTSNTNSVSEISDPLPQNSLNNSESTMRAKTTQIKSKRKRRKRRKRKKSISESITTLKADIQPEPHYRDEDIIMAFQILNDLDNSKLMIEEKQFDKALKILKNVKIESRDKQLQQCLQNRMNYLQATALYYQAQEAYEDLGDAFDCNLLKQSLEFIKKILDHNSSTNAYYNASIAFLKQLSEKSFYKKFSIECLNLLNEYKN